MINALQSLLPASIYIGATLPQVLFDVNVVVPSTSADSLECLLVDMHPSMCQNLNALDLSPILSFHPSSELELMVKPRDY